MSNISVDWRHISAALALLILITGFLVMRPGGQATFSEAVPAGSNATISNDDPNAPNPAPSVSQPVQ
ncbi:hypothetical protein EON80_12950 [bacterium]|nr:MAG: hypothetical protein EON80_12950 [bacterium]